MLVELILLGIIVVLAWMIINKKNINGFSTGGLSTINSIQLYNPPVNCFITPDGEQVCTNLGTVIV